MFDPSRWLSGVCQFVRVFDLLGVMAYNARDLPASVRAQLPEIDWGAWAALPEALVQPGEHPLKIWVAARELTPLTVQHLIDYRRVHPELFSMVL